MGEFKMLLLQNKTPFTQILSVQLVKLCMVTIVVIVTYIDIRAACLLSLYMICKNLKS